MRGLTKSVDLYFNRTTKLCFLYRDTQIFLFFRINRYRPVRRRYLFLSKIFIWCIFQNQGFYIGCSIKQESRPVCCIGFGYLIHGLDKHIVVGQETKFFPACMAFKPGEIVLYLVQGFHRQVDIGSFNN